MFDKTLRTILDGWKGKPKIRSSIERQRDNWANEHERIDDYVTTDRSGAVHTVARYRKLWKSQNKYTPNSLSPKNA